MKRKRFSVEQIVALLKQAEVGVPVAELIRQVGITEHSRIADRAYGRIGQRCPTHQVLNSNRMVAGASKLEEVQP